MYVVRHGNRQDVFFYGFRCRQHPTSFDGFHRWFLMVSVVAGNICCFMVSVVGFAMVSVVAGKHLFMVFVAGSLMDSAAAGGSKMLECIE